MALKDPPLQFGRGLEANLPASNPDGGPLWTTDSEVLWVYQSDTPIACAMVDATQTLTNKTIDTSDGNALKINGNSLTGINGASGTVLFDDGDGSAISNVLHPGDQMSFDSGAAVPITSDGTGAITANQLFLSSSFATDSGLVVSDGTGGLTANSFTGDGSALTGLNASNLASGTVPTARLGSGSASSTTFLAGDSSWKTSTGAGSVMLAISPTTTGTLSGAMAVFSTKLGVGATGTSFGTTGDIMFGRGSNTAAIYFGTNGAQYIYYDGLNFTFNGGGATFAGTISCTGGSAQIGVDKRSGGGQAFALYSNSGSLQFYLNDFGGDVFTIDSSGNAAIGGGIKIGGGTTIAKVMSATATLDFGSTAAQSSSDLTMTVTGAAVGDAVFLGVPSAPDANACFTAWVSASDTIKVRFNNYSSGAINPASATYRATVFHF